MPLPSLGLRQGPHPAGKLAVEVPDDGLPTELRVHGVGGTGPGELLDDLSPDQVAGDRIAGFYRTGDFIDPAECPSRHVEGYSWGGLNSRSSVRVLWLLLLPFMLANLAGWMCSRRVHDDPRAYRVHRRLANLVALVLTLNLVALLCLQVVDVLGYQAPLIGVLADHWWTWPLRWHVLDGRLSRQVAIGYLAVVAAVGVLMALAHASRNRYECVRPEGEVKPGDAATPASVQPGGLRSPGFWASQDAVARAANHHLAAGFAVLALVMARTQWVAVTDRPGGAALVLWWAAVVTAVLVLLVAVLALGAVDALLRVGLPFGSAGLVPVALAWLALWIGPDLTRGGRGLPGLLGVFLVLGAVLAVTLLLLWLLPELLARPRTHGPGRTPDSSGAPATPYLHGAPAVAGLLGAASLNLVGFSVAIALANVTGPVGWGRRTPDNLRIILPAWAGWLTVAAGAGIVLALLVAVVAGVVRYRNTPGPSAGEQDVVRTYGDGLLAAWRADGATAPEWVRSTLPQDWFPAPVQQQLIDLHWCDQDGKRSAAWLATVRSSRFVGRIRTVLGLAVIVLAVLPTVLATAAGVLLAVGGRSVVPGAWYSPSGWLGTTLTTGLVLIPVLLMGLLRQGWRNLAARKHIAVVFDVATFWPRSFHPLAPPCYAERAVPDLQRRLSRLTRNGAPVRLVSHSQGTVLAAAALLSAPVPAGAGPVHLVTFGSPLAKLYAWGFPAWFDASTWADLSSGGRCGVRSWQNFWYLTDPIGGPVGTDPLASPAAPGPAAPPSVARATATRPGTSTPAAAGSAPTPAVPVPAVDVLLPDPPRCWYLHGEPPPAVGGHSGYWSDPELWRRVDEACAPPAGGKPTVTAPRSPADGPLTPPAPGS